MYLHSGATKGDPSVEDRVSASFRLQNRSGLRQIPSFGRTFVDPHLERSSGK